MKKKILIVAGIIILILVVGAIYLNYRNRSMSPAGEASFSKNGLTIEVTYSRPSARGRLIFGSAEDGALLPHGVYWRFGANEATEVTINKNVLFNGNDIAAGTYKMYAVPGPQDFEISLNSEVGNWGYSEPDYSLDVLKTKVPVEKGGAHVEQFTIRFENDGSTALLVCEWSDTNIKIPIELKK